jgi:flagellar hook protein FlgE
MSVNFLITACKEASRSTDVFGICDDQNNTAAYTDIVNPSKWIAKVINEKNIEVSFTAIDNCIIILKEETKDKESTCDGMLTFENSIYLVELKEKNVGGWITEAVDQLENTIKLLLSNHSLTEYKYKKAFACN